MNTKSAVKVVKRKDVEQTIHTTSPEAEVTVDEPKAQRHSRREIVNTVSNWVKERRERNRIEEIEGIRHFFGDTSIFSKA